MSNKHMSRNPAGLATKKPIALRLTPEDRAEAERIAAKLHVSKSLLAYRAYRAGLPIVMKQSSSPAGNGTAGLCSGEATLPAASLQVARRKR